MQPESCLAPYFEYHPSRRNSESSGEARATEDPDLEELPELEPEVACFLRGSAENSEEEEEKAPSPKPPVKGLCRWVAWKAEACETPVWWREQLAGPEVQDCEELAQKVRASFHLSKRANELNNFLPPSQFYLCLPGHSRDAKREDSGICPSPPVLGREG